MKSNQPLAGHGIQAIKEDPDMLDSELSVGSSTLTYNIKRSVCRFLVPRTENTVTENQESVYEERAWFNGWFAWFLSQGDLVGQGQSRAVEQQVNQVWLVKLAREREREWEREREIVLCLVVLTDENSGAVEEALERSCATATQYLNSWPWRQNCMHPALSCSFWCFGNKTF